MIARRQREKGLGPLHTVSLKEAGSRALDCRRMKLNGIDPLEARRAARAAARLEQARSIKFKEAAAQSIAANSPAWRNAKHAQQWASTRPEYAFPVIGDLPVGDLDVALVTKLLRPIWTAKGETASRVRARIESILDFCITSGWRVGPNPAAWRGRGQRTSGRRPLWGKRVVCGTLDTDGLRESVLSAKRSGRRAACGDRARMTFIPNRGGVVATA